MASDVIIRRIKDSDYSAITTFFDDPAVVANTSQLPYSSEQHWRGLLSPSEKNIQLVAELDGRTIGHFGVLPRQKQREKHIADLAIGIHPEYHGQGVGSRMMEAALELCDNWLNILRLELQVYTDNPGGVALYKKFGFKIEGEHPYASFAQGRYSHLYTMARLRLPTQPVAELDGQTEV
ncbi:MAG: GNAT family N-acetyltransferase [Cellvibrionaceae bacterium]|nr:GNAT family N-acetyltransferase [Cellvibrionaceae bacterium]